MPTRPSSTSVRGFSRWRGQRSNCPSLIALRKVFRSRRRPGDHTAAAAAGRVSDPGEQHLLGDPDLYLLFDLHIGHSELVGWDASGSGEPGRCAPLVHKNYRVRPQHPPHVGGTRSGARGEIRWGQRHWPGATRTVSSVESAMNEQRISRSVGEHPRGRAMWTTRRHSGSGCVRCGAGVS